MEKRVLRRKLNPFLLITTVLVLAILAGSSVFYQTELNELVSSREDLNTQLENKTQKIESLERQKKNLSESLDDRAGEIERLENTNIEKENRINELEDRLTKLNSTINQLKQENEGLEIENQDLNGHLDDLNFSMGEICSSNITSTSIERRCSLHGH
ncbi:hypothetical protein GLU26_01790 [Nanohaloarchaea archaeon]|nr:hypothetical protein [Candidatus Nanohaloarchaea archaeon]